MKKTTKVLCKCFLVFAALGFATTVGANCGPTWLYTAKVESSKVLDTGVKISDEPVLKQSVTYCHPSGFFATGFLATGLDLDLGGVASEADIEGGFRKTYGTYTLLAMVSYFDLQPLEVVGKGDPIRFRFQVSREIVERLRLTFGVEYFYFMDREKMLPPPDPLTPREQLRNARSRLEAIRAKLQDPPTWHEELRVRAETRWNAWITQQQALVALPEPDNDGMMFSVGVGYTAYENGPLSVDFETALWQEHLPVTPEDGLVGKVAAHLNYVTAPNARIHAGAKLSEPLSGQRDRFGEIVWNAGFQLAW